MPACPSILISVVNGVYTYQCIECNDSSNTSIRQSDHPLQCGCPEPPNSDCEDVTTGGVGTGIGFGMMAAAPAQRLDNSAMGSHRVDESLTSRGMNAPLPADFSWPYPTAQYDPEFDGDKSFHVLRVDGTDRHVRLMKARIPSPKSLMHSTFRGKKQVVSPIPDVVLLIGHETEVRTGITPRKLVTVSKMNPGSHYVQARRAGAKADQTVFHIILARR